MTEPVSRRIALGTGLSYHVLEWGASADPAAPIVILLHGFLDFAWTWAPVVEAGLGGGRYHLVAPDLRGHGDSDRVGAGGYYHFMDYLADVHALIEAVAAPAQRVSLVGHSMGGSVAGYYAGSYPERIERLVLLEGLGPPDGDLGSMPERIRAWLQAWRRVTSQGSRQEPRSMASVDEAAARLRRFDPRLAPDVARLLAEHGTRLLPDGRRLFKHDPLHLTPGPYPFTLQIAQAFWRHITCPVLLVDAEGSEFKYAPEDDARRRGSFVSSPGVTTAVLGDAGHMMQRHQPAALARLLRDFLG